jgi:hypothetical protein
MCGFGIATIFEVAIFVIVVLVVLALLRAIVPGVFNVGAVPYGNIIRIVVGGVVAILILLFLWKLAECSGLLRGADIGAEALAATTVSL